MHTTQKWLLHSKKNFKSLSYFIVRLIWYIPNSFHCLTKNLGWCVTWLKNESVSSYFGQKEYSELKVICQCWKERNKRSFASLLHSLLQRSWKSRFIATVAKKPKEEVISLAFFLRLFYCSTDLVYFAFLFILGTTCQL